MRAQTGPDSPNRRSFYETARSRVDGRFCGFEHTLITPGRFVGVRSRIGAAWIFFEMCYLRLDQTVPPILKSQVGDTINQVHIEASGLDGPHSRSDFQPCAIWL